jgi:subtilisin family serine protease
MAKGMTGKQFVVALFVAATFAGGAVEREPEAIAPSPAEIWRDETTGAQAAAVSGQVIVRFREDVSPDAIADISRRHSLTEIRSIPPLNAYLFRLPASLSLRAAIAVLQNEPGTIYAEPNLLGNLHRVPNDPLYTAAPNYQWSLKPPVAPYYGRINGENAWDLELGSESVTVAVIDSGVDTTHPDLAPRWASWGSDTVDPIGQTNTDPQCQPDNDPYDSSNIGHGTAVSGLVSAATDNGQGIAGTAWNVRLLPLRVLGNCSGGTIASVYYTSWGIVYAGSRSDVKVLSLSLGFNLPSELMEDAVEYAYTNGKLVVASAGNDGNTVMQYPAAFPHVMGITSVDENGQKSGFSSYGAWTDIAAPGGVNYGETLGITTTDMQGNLGYASGDYSAGFGGTSASAPYVAGVAALVFSHFPNWTPDQVEQHLKATATTPPGWNALWGVGIVNAYNAVRLLDTTPPSLSLAEAIAGDRVNLTFSEAMNPTTAGDRANYTLSGGAGLSVLAVFVAPDNKTVQLLTTPQLGGIPYVVTVSESVTDTNGNPLPTSLASRQKTFIGINQDKNLALQANGGGTRAWWTTADVDFCTPDATSANANDGNIATAWTQTVGSNPNFSTFLMVRLPDAYRIDRIVVRTDPGYVLEYLVEAGWALCGVLQSIVVPRATFTGTQTFTLDPAVGAREVMVTFFSAQGSANGTARVTELEVYGEKPAESNPPQVAVTEPTDGALLRGMVTVAATATDDTAVASVEFFEGSTLLCTDTTAPYSCLWNTIAGGDGAKALTATAYDTFGNSSASAPVNVTVDNTPPETTITGKPPSPSGSPSATFEFSASEPGSSFECSLDGGAYAACGSPRTYDGLADGGHQFRVRATDLAGNTDATPAQYNWTIDTQPPETTIVAGPAEGSLTNSRSATFQFSSSKPDSTFECELDGGEWATCTSPNAYSNLGDGNHTFRVRATDAGGNADATPAERNWQVDATPPTVSITDGPGEGSSIGATNVAFEFISSETPTNTECFFNSGTWSACTSPRPYSSLGEGAHQFAVRGTDAAGNLSNTATRNFNVDTIAPVVAITSGPTDLSVTNSTSLQMEFSANEPATFECQLDGAGAAACASPFVRDGLADGRHSFTVTATDRAGNTASARRSWTVDTQPPGTVMNSGPPALTNQTSARFVFSASGTTFECKLDDTLWEACVSPKDYILLWDGPHYFEVKGTDDAGNTDPTPAAYEWTIDTVGPETIIGERPPAMTVVRTARFTFSSDDATAEFFCAVDGAAEAACTSPYDSVFAEGTHTFVVRARDAAGNFDPTPATHQWNVVTGSLLVEQGPNPAASVRVTNASLAAPILQLRLTAGALEGARITQLVVSSGGDGDDAADIAAVTLVNDADGDGQVDAGETVLATSAFSGDNGNAVFTLDSTIPAGTSAVYLVALRFRATGPSATSAIPVPKPVAGGGLLILAMLGLAGAGLCATGAARGVRALVVLTVLFAGLLTVTACGGGGGPPPVPAKTYTVSLPSANSVQATGAISGAALPASGAFPIAGATLTK